MRYLIIRGQDDYTMTNDIDKKDLVRVKTGEYEGLVDVENRTFFDARENEWRPVRVAEMS